MSKYIDISVAVSPELPTWPNTPVVKLEKSFALERGDIANDTTINFSVHTGTHIDAPSHFLPTGKSVEQIPLDLLVGTVYVAELSEQVYTVTPAILDSLNIPLGTERLLLKTRNSKLWQQQVQEFQPDFVALTADAAEWVVERNIRLIGIDYLSIQRFYDGPETHQILLAAEIVIIEGLDLTSVCSGSYKLICLPIKLKGVEGAPARVILQTLPAC